MLQKNIVGKFCEPGAEATATAKRVQFTPGAEERFLAEIFRQGMISGEFSLQQQNPGLVPTDQLFKSLEVFEADRLLNQGFITQLHRAIRARRCEVDVNQLYA